MCWEKSGQFSSNIIPGVQNFCSWTPLTDWPANRAVGQSRSTVHSAQTPLSLTPPSVMGRDGVFKLTVACFVFVRYFSILNLFYVHHFYVHHSRVHHRRRILVVGLQLII